MRRGDQEVELLVVTPLLADVPFDPELVEPDAPEVAPDDPEPEEPEPVPDAAAPFDEESDVPESVFAALSPPVPSDPFDPLPLPLRESVR